MQKVTKYVCNDGREFIKYIDAFNYLNSNIHKAYVNLSSYLCNNEFKMNTVSEMIDSNLIPLVEAYKLAKLELHELETIDDEIGALYND